MTQERSFTEAEEEKLDGVKLIFELVSNMNYAHSIPTTIEKFIAWMDGPSSQDHSFREPEYTIWRLLVRELRGLYIGRPDTESGYSSHDYYKWFFRKMSLDVEEVE